MLIICKIRCYIFWDQQKAIDFIDLQTIQPMD